MRRLIVLSLSAGMAVVPAVAPAAFGLAAPAYGSAAPAYGSAAPAYALTDVGTFGGPQASLDLMGYPITRQGAVVGTADTTVADRDYPNNNPFIVNYPDRFLTRAFTWRDGKLTDLGALPGNNSSAVFQINGSGIGAGMSETGTLDPNTGYPAENAVLFKDGSVRNLGTLPGGHESQATAINDRGQVAGFSSNGIPDPLSIFGWGTQARSFIWQHGKMHDLGTLGGPDAVMTELNARGQIAGDSYVNDTPNPVTRVPTTHPFLWQHGHLRDLGTLGGTLSSTSWLNNKGEVTGQDNLAGNQASRPFLWDGHRLRDLGTLGGDFGGASQVNDAGVVTGWTFLPGDRIAHAFVWKHGVMTDLTGARSPQCTIAEAINNRGQVVGHTCNEHDALLWAGGRQFDLNALVAPSRIHLTGAFFITSQGQIVATGQLPNGRQHVFLLTPTHSPLSAAATRISRQPSGNARNLISTPAQRFVPQWLANPRQSMAR